MLSSATSLSPPDGLALCSRWDDENFFDIKEGIVPTVQAAAQARFLSPLESLALLRLTGEGHDISADVLPLLEQLRNEGAPARPQLSHAAATISVWVRRDAPLSSRKRAAARILGWFEQHGLWGLPGLAELRELSAFLDRLPERVETSAYQHEPDREARIRTLLADARDGELKQFEARLRSVWRVSYGGQPVADLVTIYGKALKPAQRVEFLDCLVAASADDLFAKDIIAPLHALLAEWRHHIDVREWLPGGIQRLLENSLPGLLRYEYETSEHLRAALSLPGLSHILRSRLLLPAISRYLNEFGPRRLYWLAEVLAETLSASEVRELLDWALNKTERHFDEHRRSLPPLAMPAQVETAPAALARFCWSFFGHADKRIRWRALHSARFILKLPNDELLRELLSLACAETAGAFRSTNPKLEFYWLSARAWLLLLLQRLSD
jgi:hypothetical protein